MPTVSVPVVEIHYTNPAKAGVVSLISPVCHSVIVGLGIEGYGWMRWREKGRRRDGKVERKKKRIGRRGEKGAGLLASALIIKKYIS